MNFIPRLICPENGNKYYNRKVNGGYSTCIQGNKSKGCYNPQLDVLPNCVGYAAGRFNEIGDYKQFKYCIPGNAEDWFNNAKRLGLKTGDTPKLGSVICWSSGKLHNGSDGAGHVAIVEKILSDGRIVTSESGWNANRLFWTQQRSKGTSGNWGQSKSYSFLGFIYNPAVPDEPIPPKDYLSKGDKGPEVVQLQKDLNTFGWYDLSEDGSFGPATEKAVIDFQTKLGITVDGIYGPESKEALKNANNVPSGTSLITIIYNGKERHLTAKIIDDNTFIKLRDIDWKFNFADVDYNKNKKLPEVKDR